MAKILLSKFTFLLHSVQSLSLSQSPCKNYEGIKNSHAKNKYVRSPDIDLYPAPGMLTAVLYLH